MFHENEIVMLLVGVGVWGYSFLNRSILQRIPGFKYLFTSFSILCLGWIATILEEFGLPTLLNYVEHICYALSSIVLAYWAWLTMQPPKDSQV